MKTAFPALLDILAARRRLRSSLLTTPLLHSEWLSEATGADTYIKIESLQRSRSFKIRGALNAVAKLTAHAAGSSQIIVTASAGNHGRAIAAAAAEHGVRAVVFTPSTAPQVKKAAIRRHGAELQEVVDYDTAEVEARRYAAERGATYLSPYNHIDVIAGAGTLAFELLEASPAFDVLVVPIGGGGLASGLGIALKSAAPHVRIVGVEAEASTPFATGFARGEITRITPRPSLADGLTGNLEPGSITFELVRRYVDELVSVGELNLAQAIRGLAAEEHLIVEGAGAAATAAVLARGVVKPGKRAIVLITGGNIDLRQFPGTVPG